MTLTIFITQSLDIINNFKVSVIMEPTFTSMKILIYPRARNNAYHELLYGQLQSSHPNDTFTYISAGPLTAIMPFVLLFRRLQGYKVFHLHWHAFFAPQELKLPTRGRISLWNTLWSLHLIKWLGYKLIWTAHNALPHEQQTADDKRVLRATTKLANAVIVHSSQTLNDLRELGANTDRAVIIPHGNYDGVYPISLTRGQAREVLGINDRETAILFFGNIRPYKGVEDNLLPAFSKLSKNTKHLKLIIAGKCLNQKLSKTINDFAAKHDNVTFAEGSVADSDVAQFFQAADVVCLPFKSITTSGSVILAATFSKPIITPRLGAIKDIPKDVGVLYDPSKPDALLNAMEQIINSPAKLDSMAKASRAYADTLAWDKLAQKTYKAYTES